MIEEKSSCLRYSSILWSGRSIPSCNSFLDDLAIVSRSKMTYVRRLYKAWILVAEVAVVVDVFEHIIEFSADTSRLQLVQRVVRELFVGAINTLNLPPEFSPLFPRQCTGNAAEI